MAAYVAGTVFAVFWDDSSSDHRRALELARRLVTLGILDLLGSAGRAPMAATGGQFCSRQTCVQVPRVIRGVTCGNPRLLAICGLGIHRPVFAGGRIYLREFISPNRLSTSLPPNWAASFLSICWAVS